MIYRLMNCCGGIELVGINDVSWNPETYIKYYAERTSIVHDKSVQCRRTGKGFITISYAYDVFSHGAGFRTKKQGLKRIKALKNFLEENKLGTIMIAKEHTYNPNYGRSIKLIPAIIQPNNMNIRNYFRDKDETEDWSIS